MGRIVTDRLGRTDIPRVFAGGDSIGCRAFVADAIASGKMGAFAIACFFEGKEAEREFQDHQIGDAQGFSFHHFLNIPLEKPVDLRKVVTFDQINTLFFRESARNRPEQIDIAIRKKTFKEVTRGLKSSKMEDETSRCFKCGTCIDCEHCLDFCPDISILKNDGLLGLYSFDEDHCKGCGMCYVACPRHVIEMGSEVR
jgi:Pyruvate/2-oxoacid:ferredoxin oxidoreductase delta subunit